MRSKSNALKAPPYFQEFSPKGRRPFLGWLLVVCLLGSARAGAADRQQENCAFWISELAKQQGELVISSDRVEEIFTSLHGSVAEVLESANRQPHRLPPRADPRTPSSIAADLTLAAPDGIYPARKTEVSPPKEGRRIARTKVSSLDEIFDRLEALRHLAKADSGKVPFRHWGYELVGKEAIERYLLQLIPRANAKLSPKSEDYYPNELAANSPYREAGVGQAITWGIGGALGFAAIFGGPVAVLEFKLQQFFEQNLGFCLRIWLASILLPLVPPAFFEHQGLFYDSAVLVPHNEIAALAVLDFIKTDVSRPIPSAEYESPAPRSWLHSLKAYVGFSEGTTRHVDLLFTRDRGVPRITVLVGE